MITASDIWTRLEQIRSKKPLVLNITNMVVPKITANALLALGASPAMAKSEHEIEELVSLSRALVLNTGTPTVSQVRVMRLAAAKALELDIPVVLDPVGAGASRMRIDVPLELMANGWVQILRGNASEVMALAGNQDKPRGVDSLHSSEQALNAAHELCDKYDCAVCVSGEQDLVVAKEGSLKICNGHHLMSRVTGMGCSSTCLVAAFAAVEKDLFRAVGMGMAVMGLAGEMAATEAAGPGSLETAFLDTMYALDREMLENIRWEKGD